MGKWDEFDPLYDEERKDTNPSENKEIKTSIKKVKVKKIKYKGKQYPLECSECHKELTELEWLKFKCNDKSYCEEHFPLETFDCIECGNTYILELRIESNSDVGICKSCLNELVKCNMFL